MYTWGGKDRYMNLITNKLQFYLNPKIQLHMTLITGGYIKIIEYSNFEDISEYF